IERVIHSIIAFTGPPREPVLVRTDHVDRSIVRSPIYDNILQVGVTLIDNRAQRLLDMTRSIQHWGHERDARPLSGRHAGVTEAVGNRNQLVWPKRRDARWEARQGCTRSAPRARTEATYPVL